MASSSFHTSIPPTSPNFGDPSPPSNIPQTLALRDGLGLESPSTSFLDDLYDTGNKEIETSQPFSSAPLNSSYSS